MFLLFGRAAHARKTTRLEAARRCVQAAKRLRGRERQLTFLSGAFERFRRALDPINDLIVSLDWYQTDYLVFAARSIPLEWPLEVHKLAN